MKIQCIWDGHATLGEGPLWHAEEQALYFLDIVQKKIHRYDEKTGQTEDIAVPETVTCMVLSKKGDCVVAWRNGVGRFDLKTRQLQDIKTLLAPGSLEMFNDGKCDRQGRFWVGTRHTLEAEGHGVFYRSVSFGELMPVDTGYIVSNGPAFSPDGHTLYEADSGRKTIYAFDVDVKSGALSNKRVFAVLPDGTGYPDGLTVDAEGYLWNGHWAGSRLTRYRPDGSVNRVIAMPVPNVTSACFGGKDLGTLYVTTAARDLSADDLKKTPQAGGLFALDVGVKGLPEAACIF